MTEQTPLIFGVRTYSDLGADPALPFVVRNQTLPDRGGRGEDPIRTSGDRDASADDRARVFLTDFAGMYAADPRSHATLQSLISLTGPNCPVAPSEQNRVRGAGMQFFARVIHRDETLTPGQRSDRMRQLKDSLANLSDRFELPPLKSLATSPASLHHTHRASHRAAPAAPMTRYREAQAFLREFAQTYAADGHDHELLQGAIDITARGHSLIGRADRGAARNEVLRHFENKVRRVELKAAAEQAEGLDHEARAKLVGEAGEKAEAVNVKLGESLRAIQYGFSLDTGAAARR